VGHCDAGFSLIDERKEKEDKGEGLCKKRMDCCEEEFWDAAPGFVLILFLDDHVARGKLKELGVGEKGAKRGQNHRPLSSCMVKRGGGREGT